MSAAEAMPVLIEWCAATDFPGSLASSLVAAESGFDLDAIGDGGLAHGGIQVRTDVHGGTHDTWSGPDGLRRSLAEMGGRWLSTLAEFGGRSMWDTMMHIESNVSYFMDYWPRAQGADASRITLQQCRDAVTAGVAAWARYGSDQPTQEPTSMVLRPTMIQMPADPRNVNVRPPGVLYEGLVVHTTAGGSTIEQLGNWFAGGNIAAGLFGSTHFGVDRTGRIGQFVQLNQQPIAHGQENASTAKILQGNEGVSANAFLIGVEHLDAGTAGSVTDAQLEASAWLMAWLWETEIKPHADITGAVLDLDHLIQHKDLAPVSKPLCASWPPARMAQHLERIKARLAGPVVPPPPPPPFDYAAHYAAGLTLARKGLLDLKTFIDEQIKGIDNVLAR